MESASPKKKPGKRGPIMPRIGKTVDGVDYITTHTCPGCTAVMTTIGSGYPQLVCSQCVMPMVAKSKKVGR